MYVPRRKAIHNFYEFQKKCLELSADYYQGIANLLRDTDVSLFISPVNQSDSSLHIINETSMVRGLVNPGQGGFVAPENFKKRKDRSYDNSEGSEEETGPEKNKPRNRRAPRQIWTDEEVERLKAAHEKYKGDWELVIKEFEPDRTRIQIFQKARQIGLRAVESGKAIDSTKQTASGSSQVKDEGMTNEEDELDNTDEETGAQSQSGTNQEVTWEGNTAQEENGNDRNGNDSVGSGEAA